MLEGLFRSKTCSCPSGLSVDRSVQSSIGINPTVLAMTYTTPIRYLRKAIRQNDFYWRYIANAKPWLEYRLNGFARTAPVQRTIVEDLRQHGLAMTTAQALFGDSGLFDELQAKVSELERGMANEIMEARKQKDADGFKTFLVQLLGPRPILDHQSIFTRIAVTPAVLGIVNGYFGLLARLKFYNVWLNFASTASARYSQLWHRDPEDRYILKMFIYLTEVDDEAGPLFYAPGTHGYGNVKAEPQLYREEGTTAWRANDGDMNAVVPQEKWIKAVGPKGTIVFLDTRGYHKGGLARTKDRLAYNCMFTSQVGAFVDYFERPAVMPVVNNKPTSFALAKA